MHYFSISLICLKKSKMPYITEGVDLIKPANVWANILAAAPVK